jgi:demethylmenaquinone methyltransferase/2-methoxy-6-polyprenyl-1,4-benzoquinol methylase
MAGYRSKYRWFYNNIHSVYYDLLMKWCFLPFGGEWKCRNDMISGVEFSENDRILDMCCGTGGATFSIAEGTPKNCEIVGMDISSGQIKRANRKNKFENVKFIEQDVRETKYPDEHFEKVFITHSLHEMPRMDRYAVLAEAKRILKGGGILVILELDRPDIFLLRMLAGLWFFYWLPFNFETPTRRDMLKHGLKKEVLDSGFIDVKKISKFKGMLQVVVGKRD